MISSAKSIQRHNGIDESKEPSDDAATSTAERDDNRMSLHITGLFVLVFLRKYFGSRKA